VVSSPGVMRSCDLHSATYVFRDIVLDVMQDVSVESVVQCRATGVLSDSSQGLISDTWMPCNLVLSGFWYEGVVTTSWYLL